MSTRFIAVLAMLAELALPLLTGCANTGRDGFDVHNVQEVIPAVVTEVRPAGTPSAGATTTYQEITVKLASGRMIAITQPTGEAFAPGDAVRVLSGNGITHVSH